jgi:Fe-S cluster biogenesis protein NfuA/nitrite reductase/ring-hydroxylating ferredoxin subunit
MMEIIDGAGDSIRSILERFTGDQVIGSLLLLYNLHPVDLASRVQQALEQVRPYLRSHHGDVELLRIEEGVVYLRLNGTCSSCPSSSLTLKLAVERAIYDIAPDVAAIQTDGIAMQPPMSQLNGSANLHAASQDVAWEDVKGLDALCDGSARSFQIAGKTILLCRLGETVYAYESCCPACSRELEVHRLEGATIICPACGRRYDAIHAGRALDSAELFLAPFPILMANGQTKVALPHGAH